MSLFDGLEPCLQGFHIVVVLLLSDGGRLGLDRSGASSCGPTHRNSGELMQDLVDLLISSL